MKKRSRTRRRSKTWQLQDAKSQFSRLVDEVIEDGYHTITRNGHPVVVVISQKEFDERVSPRESLLEFFMRAPYPEVELDIQRDKDTGRDVEL